MVLIIYFGLDNLMHVYSSAFIRRVYRYHPLPERPVNAIAHVPGMGTGVWIFFIFFFCLKHV
jgi:hypothetical protein